MKAEDLKNSILQLAMQGKLVPQDDNDEPASVLLEKIQKEKEKLIKDKKIKRNNKESFIYRENDHFYEKIGKKGEPICIDNEIPFDIPNNWEICRLDNLAQLNGGHAFKSSEFKNEGVRVIRISDFNENGFKNDKIVYYDEKKELDKFVLENNDILMAMTGGTVGKTFHVKKLSEKMYVNQRVADIKLTNLIDDNYIYLILQSSFIKGIIHKNKNSTNDNISMKTIGSFLMFIPPIDEQKRIVKKIEEILPLINEYGYNEEQLSTLNSKLPKNLKDSILQEAVQGNLVPQDPNDEPAYVLLEKIKQEKEELIKAKKIKKNNKESFIYKEDGHYYEKMGNGGKLICIDDEIPFDIPDSWEWCRLENICTKITDGSHNPPPKKESGVPVLSVKNIVDDKIDFNTITRFTDKEGFEKENKRTNIGKGDVLLGIIGASIGEVCIYDSNIKVIAQRSLAIIKPLISNKYLEVLFKSNYFDDFANDNSKGSAQRGLYLSTLKRFFVPLPPFNEQKRIVDKVEQLFENVDVFN